MVPFFKEKLIEVLNAVMPLVGVVCILQIALVQAPMSEFLQFLGGAVLVVVGMTLLFAGVDLGILPMGRFIGSELPKKGSVGLIIAVAFGLGFSTTIAEPDVLVLAGQVDRLSGGDLSRLTVLYTTGVGVAIFAALGMARVIFGFSIRRLLAGSYAVVLVLTFVAPLEFVPLAYDAGSVTTGALTTPVVIALAIGVSSVLAGRSAVSDGFGLLGLGSVGPIITILLMGMVLA
ncbi:MAG TPA: DUF1538 domain-containing protein [Alphaproteobacteria bacterium]